MSLISQSRRPKAPSPEGLRPRLYGARFTYQPLDLGALQARTHFFNKGSHHNIPGGAFGGRTVAARKAALNNKAAIEKRLTKGLSVRQRLSFMARRLTANIMGAGAAPVEIVSHPSAVGAISHPTGGAS